MFQNFVDMFIYILMSFLLKSSQNYTLWCSHKSEEVTMVVCVWKSFPGIRELISSKERSTTPNERHQRAHTLFMGRSCQEKSSEQFFNKHYDRRYISILNSIYNFKCVIYSVNMANIFYKYRDTLLHSNKIQLDILEIIIITWYCQYFIRFWG